MIPLADENPTRSKPYIVYMLLILNVFVYLVDALGRQGPIGGLWSYSMIPKAVVTNEPTQHIVRMVVGNTLQQYKIIHQGLDPQWLTIFTSMFMHASLMHIGGNMLYLWIFGNNIEDVLGHFKFLVFYLACGFLAAVAHILSDVNSVIPTVGASGAIAGILGAYILLFPGARVRTMIIFGWFIDFVALPASLVLGVWFLIQLTGLAGTGGQIGGGVAYWAHVGGFVAGLVIIWTLGCKRLVRQRRTYQTTYSQRPYPWRPWR